MVGRYSYRYHYWGPVNRDGHVPLRPLLDVHLVFWVFQSMFRCDLCFTLDAWISLLNDVSILFDAFLYDVVMAYC